MAYLISAHVTRELSEVNAFGKLPASIGWRVYHHRTANVYVIDTFRSEHPPELPFQWPLPVVDIPLELPRELSQLEGVYDALLARNLANSFKKSYVNFSLLVNRLLGTPILSFISDDDELDFACVTRRGTLSRLAFRAGDLVVRYSSGRTWIEPLAYPFEEDVELLTDVNGLRSALPEVPVAERRPVSESPLHAIAVEQWQQFSGSESLILGLGSFDPPDDEADLHLIGSSR